MGIWRKNIPGRNKKCKDPKMVTGKTRTPVWLRLSERNHSRSWGRGMIVRKSKKNYGTKKWQKKVIKKKEPN